ncbi:MAG TPA: peptidase M28, partial [Bacilli bacterium]|nr:peptidase M28 [Bacilli bacterium]
MDKQKLDLLKRLSEVDGISGDEKEVAQLVKGELESFTEITFDNLGSLIATLPGTEKEAPVVMLSAHMDEVGFVVKAIEKGGYLRLHNVGGWWPHVTLAQEWTVKTRSGQKYIAVTGAQPPHGMPPEQRNKVLEIKDLYLDLGVKDKDAVLALGIQVGDTVAPKQSFRVMNDG